MNILKFNTIGLMLAGALFFTACVQEPTFTIKGSIANGEGRTLYLSNVGTVGARYIDSVKLDKKGTFSFSKERPECYDFYRLQLDKKGRQITIAIDSTETVTVRSDARALIDSCRIEGSPQSVKIAELDALEAALGKQVNMLIEGSGPEIGQTRETIYTIINEFKQNICKEYIMPAPHAASAYYALFLSVNGSPLFDPLSNRFDSRCYSAVATGLNHHHPHATRAQHLSNLAIKGMRATQPARRDTIYIDTDDGSAKGLFDIKLPNIDGDTLSLTALKGKVVMLDFTLYSNAKISARNLELRDIYEKYKARGFEIYQISFDGNEHFWKTSAANLPWQCVYDGGGSSSYNLTLYQVSKIPTFFLINRANEIVLRDEQIEDLNKSIEALLREK
ncbi:MAG: AhpC/TSA family protein [Bacteroidaceae bacterium]|nr:AhpC/TSA family protein [Bacteroidaceae bacterium]